MVIALLVKLGALPNSWKKYDMENVALALQNFLICIEMLIAAVAHFFVFSHKPFIDPAAAQVSLPPLLHCQSPLAPWLYRLLASCVCVCGVTIPCIPHAGTLFCIVHSNAGREGRVWRCENTLCGPHPTAKTGQ